MGATALPGRGAVRAGSVSDGEINPSLTLPARTAAHQVVLLGGKSGAAFPRAGARFAPPPGCHARSLRRSTPMRALTVEPGRAESARVEDVPEPPVSNGPVLVRALAVGVCGTD